METLVNLEELYISHNKLTCFPDLASNKRLRILDISNNKISSLDKVEELKALKELWVGLVHFGESLLFKANDNYIQDEKEISRIRSLELLDTLYLDGNPISKEPQYMNIIKFYCPNLKQLDSIIVS